MPDIRTINDMPVTPDTMKERYTDHPLYKDFVCFFVSGVVGIRHFDKHKCHDPISKYITISDEAFAVLTLENNWDRWSSMAAKNEWKDSEIHSKWTTSNEKRKEVSMNQDAEESDSDEVTPQAKRFRGWSARGIARYNQIFSEIKEERTKQNYKEFEDYCTTEFLEEAEREGKNMSKRQKVQVEKALPTAKHELWDEDQLLEEEEEAGTVRKSLPKHLSGIAGLGEMAGV